MANLDRVFGQVGRDRSGPPARALEVGCGEGVIADRLHRALGRGRRPRSARRRPAGRLARLAGPRFLHASAHQLPFGDDQFDVVVAAEVLEHLPDPVKGLQEMARVGRRHLVLSVPREPVFRSCNLVAGRYVRDLGNTPGHLNHWSKRGFVRFVSQVAQVRAVTSPFPWTTIWATLPGR